MTKIEFTGILTEMGFELGYSNWFLKIGEFDTNKQLQITFIDEIDSRFQLSLVSLSKGMQSGESFGIFDLKTFGDDDIQMPVFLSFLNGSFVSETGTPNTKITKYIRNNKIEDILK